MKNVKVQVAMDHKEWFHQWFDSPFYQKLYAYRNDEEAAGFIDELVNELRPAANAEMLDLGCGNGRHSKILARKGFNVTGIDLASSSIREAKRSETHSLRFYRQDMRLPFGKDCFDYVFNFFTSFGYFKTDLDDDRVIENISDSLKCGGVLVMDYLNTSYAEKTMIKEEMKEIDGVIYRVTRWGDDTCFFKKIVIQDGLFGDVPEHVERVRKFNVTDFEKMFAKHELRIQHLYGNYRLNDYDEDKSPRLILVAQKFPRPK